MKRIVFIFFLSLLSMPVAVDAAVVSTTRTDRITSGLVGHWTFDGTNMTNGRVDDVSGQGNHGNTKNIASSTFYTAGKMGQGVRFDGVNDCVNMGTPSSLDITGAVTVSAWVKLNTSGNTRGIAIKGTTSGATATFQYALYDTGSGRVTFRVTNTSPTSLSSQTSTQTVTNGVWHHLVGTYNGTDTTTLYFNGALIDTDTTASFGTLNSAVGAFVVGGQPTTCTSSPLDGTVDDVRVYNRALSASEVAALYKLGSHQLDANTSRNDRVKNGLVGLWTFDGPDMLTNVADRSGQGNNGFLTNFAATSSAVKAGVSGQALSFDGVDDRVLISTVPTVTQPYAVSLWFRFPSLSGNRHLITFGSGNPTPTIILTSNNQIEIDGGSSGTFRTFCNKTFTASDVNKWWHLTILVNSSTDASQWKCYLNGVDMGVTSSSSSGTYSDPPTTNWTIGNYPALSNRFYQGSLDDVRIYNRALTQAEITALYNLGNHSAAANSSRNSNRINNIIGLWSFDGSDLSTNALTAYDRSGSGNNGTISNFSTSSVAVGKLGQALKFNGSTTGIDMGDTNEPSVITISAWVKPDAVTGGKEIISKGGTVPTGGSSQYGLSTDEASTDKFTAVFNSSSISQDVCTSTGTAGSYRARVWTFVAATYDGSTCKIYVNGVDVTTVVSDVASGNLRNTTSSLRIGKTGNASVNDSAYFAGAIDDVRIYNSALSATEVLRIYNLGK